MVDPRVTIVIPASGHARAIVGVLDRLFEAVTLSCEVIVVVDDRLDPAMPVVLEYAERESRLRCHVSKCGNGSGNAIRSAMTAARADVLVVMMPDGRDDPSQIDDLARLVERGCAVAAASRYSRGGQLAGAPRVRGFVSRGACRSLRLFSRVGTSDATNSFKACSAAFARRAGIDSADGFGVGIELTAKARRLRLPIAEIPTIGVDHLAEVPGLEIVRWIPAYLRWYRFCFGPPLTIAQLRAKTAPHAPAHAAPTSAS
ncbi:MAG TPA: glycosyltransferase family 2 protein [Streptosporangiaceae bacterium]|nr:glycosyltransferase family 2 protein [Streptosporangiaceae bacterium]